jgi:hypothetical protein
MCYFAADFYEKMLQSEGTIEEFSTSESGSMKLQWEEFTT